MEINGPIISFTFLIPVIRTTYLHQTIHSLLTQTYKDFKVIVLDDSFENNVQQIINSFDDGRIKYYRTKGGVGVKDPTLSWNYGLQLIHSSYFILVGDDDYLSENYLYEIEKLIKEYPESSLFRTRLVIVDSENKKMLYGWPLPVREYWDEYLYFRNMFGRSHSTTEFCIKTDSLKSSGGYISQPSAIGSDDLTYLLLSLKSPIISTNNAYAYWRRHGTNASMVVNYTDYNLALKKLFLEEEEIIKLNIPNIIPKDLLLKSIHNKANTYSIKRKIKYLLYSNRIARPLIERLFKRNIIKNI
jgi:glycosyltransferase involved in cell wall biosynthesis